MVLYNCDICNYSTIRKNQYQRHLNTKKHLKKICIGGNKVVDNKPESMYLNAPIRFLIRIHPKTTDIRRINNRSD